MLIMHIGFLACFHVISLERSRFSKIATLFVWCAAHTVVCIVGSGCVWRVSHVMCMVREDTQNDYCNPRCACAPRVNKYMTIYRRRAPVVPLYRRLASLAIIHRGDRIVPRFLLTYNV